MFSGPRGPRSKTRSKPLLTAPYRTQPVKLKPAPPAPSSTAPRSSKSDASPEKRRGSASSTSGAPAQCASSAAASWTGM